VGIARAEKVWRSSSNFVGPLHCSKPFRSVVTLKNQRRKLSQSTGVPAREHCPAKPYESHFTTRCGAARRLMSSSSWVASRKPTTTMIPNRSGNTSYASLSKQKEKIENRAPLHRGKHVCGSGKKNSANGPRLAKQPFANAASSFHLVSFTERLIALGTRGTVE